MRALALCLLLSACGARTGETGSGAISEPDPCQRLAEYRAELDAEGCGQAGLDEVLLVHGATMACDTVIARLDTCSEDPSCSEAYARSLLSLGCRAAIPWVR